MPSKPHMGNAEGGRILQFCSDLLQLLHLSQHELILDNEPCDSDAYAEIHPTKDRFAALVRVCEEWNELPEDRKIQVLAHEMLHLTHAHLESDTLSVLRRSSAVSPDLFSSVETILHSHCERWVDRMTWVVVNGYDLKYPKKAKGELKAVK